MYRFSIIYIILICFCANIITTCQKFTDLPKTMKAVGYFKNLPISSEDSLLDLEVNIPNLDDTDVLVEVKAIAVNPVDVKIRAYAPAIGGAKILGWDGSGVIVGKGDQVKTFNIGDEVFFVGDIRRNGSNAQYVALNEIVVGPKPKKLSFEEAAAVPLTFTTAYESIYDRLLISEKDKGKSLLIINAAGGVGSVASQLAKNLGLIVIGTASRPETEAFARENGVDIVINHRRDLKPQLEAHGFSKGVDYILVNYDPYPYWDTLTKIVAAQAKICLIVPSSGLVDLKPFIDKSVTVVSETIQTRLVYNTDDVGRLQEIMMDISKMLEEGKLKTTVTKVLSPINAANLKEAHRLVEKQSTLGKLVLSGF